MINNAGLSSADNKVSKEGMEETFAICHVGHFLSLLWQKLVSSSNTKLKSRVVTVSSTAHTNVTKIDYDLMNNSKKNSDGFLSVVASYSVSKFSNVLFTTELARRRKNSPVLVFLLMPGVVATLLSGWLFATEETRKLTTNYCAASPN